MKCTALLLVLACLLVSASCVQVMKPAHSFIKQWIFPALGAPVDTCKMCLDFDKDAINALLNIILQGGVANTCGALCSALAQKTGKQALGAVCEVLCMVAGVDEFVHLLNEVDIDPILFCEDMKACPINDNGDAKFTQFDVTPKSGPQGEFDIAFQYSSQNGTGTGQIVLDIDTVDGLPLGEAFLHEIAGPGTYNGVFKLNAEPDPDCDPTQGFCESWEPGNYTVKMAICNGECGSKHPHSKVYDETTTQFVITKKDQ